MKIIHINAGFAGSIKRVISGIIQSGDHDDIHFLAAPNRRKEKVIFENYIKIGNIFERTFSRIFYRIFGIEGLTNFFSTLSLLRKIQKIKPDVVHLHLLHGNYINISLLFNYLSNYNGKIVWTLHDTWAFTGKCVHFDSVNCSKWQKGCNNCPLLNKYPKSFFDSTKYNYNLKNKLIQKLNNITFVTPSKWLEDRFRASFLSSKKVITINNGVALEQFKPLNSSFRAKHNLSKDIFIILGVAFNLTIEKGLNFYHELVNFLPVNFKIVLVGNINFNKIEKNEKIIYINNSKTINNLVEIYNGADVFLNATQEEVFGIVNVEALACGLPVITFNSGGAAETINEDSGIVVKKNNIQQTLDALNRIYSSKPFSKEACILRARQFDYKKLSLYNHIYNEVKI